MVATAIRAVGRILLRRRDRSNLITPELRRVLAALDPDVTRRSWVLEPPPPADHPRIHFLLCEGGPGGVVVERRARG